MTYFFGKALSSTNASQAEVEEDGCIEKTIVGSSAEGNQSINEKLVNSLMRSPMKKTTLRAPYLVFLGNETNESYAKTGMGMVQWRPELCMGQICLPGGTVNLGLPAHTVQSAVAAGAKSLIIGTAAVGGSIPDHWLPILEEAVLAGLDIVAGVHTPIGKIEGLALAAQQTGARLIDVRIAPEDLPVGTGRKRTGRRLLTVGTDCALGKKYTALALEREMQAQQMKVSFKATGQTGIMIAGEGIPIDAVVGDFTSGAAELLSPDNDVDHWDVIEGQGGLFHPGYAAVSMGLLMGSQPDAFVVCTEFGRTHMIGWPDFKLPSIEEVIKRTIDIGRQVNPAIRCVGISVNSSSLTGQRRKDWIAQLADVHGVPCVDPLIDGTGPIVEYLKGIY